MANEESGRRVRKETGVCGMYERGRKVKGVFESKGGAFGMKLLKRKV